MLLAATRRRRENTFKANKFAKKQLRVSTTNTRKEEESVDNLEPSINMISSSKDLRSPACYSDDTLLGVGRVKTPGDYESVARGDSLPLLEPKLPDDSPIKLENTAPTIINNESTNQNGYEEQVMNQSFGLVSQLILDEFSPRTRVISKINN